MAADEIPPFEKPDELTAPDTLSLLRSYALGQIQKRTREAMKPSQQDLSEGALPEAPPPPGQEEQPVRPTNPFPNPYEYDEEEA
jgi:hypothetical protein